MTSPYYEFYSEKRWKNWINQVKETKFTLADDPKNEVAIFVNMADDVILSCLKVIARFDKEAMTSEEANTTIESIQNIVLAEVPAISEDIDIMILSVQDALSCSLYSFRLYIAGNADMDADISALIETAFEAEESGDIETAFDTVAFIGSCVIAGAIFDDEILAEIPDERLETATATWLDGIETISAAMVGTDSYKNFDEEDDEEQI